MIHSFRDTWLENFFADGTGHQELPATIESALARQLDIIDAAVDKRDLGVYLDPHTYR